MVQMKQDSINNCAFGSQATQLTAINLSHESTCFLVETTTKILDSYGGEESFGLRSAAMWHSVVW